MFLSSLLDTELEEQRKRDRHVLKHFAGQAATRLCLTTVKQLMDPSAVSKVNDLLSTQEHVLWSMEAVGHSFALSIEDHEIIADALSIYTRWLYDDVKRPKAINEDQTRFFNNMFCHLSLLFATRRSSSSMFERHVTLCQKALNVYSYASKKLADTLSDECWATLLKILLAISDELLHGPDEKHSLGTALEQQCLRVLFDAWLRFAAAGCHFELYPYMWALFAKFSRRWVHRKWFIKKWNLTCRALTRRVSRVLQQPDAEDDGEIIVKWSEEHKASITAVFLDDKTSMYTWYQVLHVIIGHDPKHINEPDTFLAAATGVAELSDYFLSLSCASHTQRLNTALAMAGSSPSISDNPILHTFGPWLSEVAQNACFEEGQATGIAALCRIVCRQQKDLFSDADLARYYSIMIQVMSSQTTKSPSVRQLVLHSANIFSVGLKGVGILIPQFMPHLRNILNDTSDSFSVELRSAAINIAASLLPLNNHFFGNVEGVNQVPLETSEEQRAQMKILSQMRHHLLSISNCLLNALDAERDMGNLELLLWTIGVRIHSLEKFQMTALSEGELEASPKAYHVAIMKNSSFAQLAINQIWKILSSSGTWSLKVTLTGLQMLADVASVGPIISQNDNGDEDILSFVSRLCRFIAHHIARLNQKQTKYSAATFQNAAQLQPQQARDAKRDMKRSAMLVTEAVWCLYSWIAHNPWVLTQAPAAPALSRTSSLDSFKPDGSAQSLAHGVSQCAIFGLQFNTSHGVGEDVHNACLHLLRFMMYGCGRDTFDRQVSVQSVDPNTPLHALLEWSLARSSSKAKSLVLGNSIQQLRGGVQLSSKLTEWDIMKYMLHKESLSSVQQGLDPDEPAHVMQALSEHTRFFLINKRVLVSFIESPYSLEDIQSGITDDTVPTAAHSRTPCTIIVVRDIAGKYVWQARGRYQTPKVQDEVNDAVESTFTREHTHFAEILATRGVDVFERSVRLNADGVPDLPTDEVKKEQEPVMVPGRSRVSVLVPPPSPSVTSQGSKVAAKDYPDGGRKVSITASRVESKWRAQQGAKEASKATISDIDGLLKKQFMTECKAHVAGSKGLYVASGNEDPPSTLRMSSLPRHARYRSQGMSHRDEVPDQTPCFPDTSFLLSSLNLVTPFSPVTEAQPYPPHIKTGAENRSTSEPQQIKGISRGDEEPVFSPPTEADVQVLAPSKQLLYTAHALDCLPGCDTFTVAVLYRKPGQIEESEMTVNRLSSSHRPQAVNAFKRFIHEMSPSVDLSAHRSYPGNYHAGDTDRILWYSTLRYEAVFHVPSMMRSDVPDERRLALVSQDQVRVIWSEDHNLFEPAARSMFDLGKPIETDAEADDAVFHALNRASSALRQWASTPSDERQPKQHPIVSIVLYPTSAGLYRVKIHAGVAARPISALERPLSPILDDGEESSLDSVPVSPRGRGMSEAPRASISMPSSPKRRASGFAIPARTAQAGRRHSSQRRKPPSSTYSSLLTAGPLIDEMLVSIDSLPHFVRQTSLNASKLVHQIERGKAFAFSPRRKLIERLVSCDDIPVRGDLLKPDVADIKSPSYFYQAMFSSSRRVKELGSLSM